jgi:hypothetical protein
MLLQFRSKTLPIFFYDSNGSPGCRYCNQILSCFFPVSYITLKESTIMILLQKTYYSHV